MSLFYAWLYNRISKWTFICWYFKEGSSSMSPRVFEFFFFWENVTFVFMVLHFWKPQHIFHGTFKIMPGDDIFQRLKWLKRNNRRIYEHACTFHALETRLRRCPTSSGYDRNLFSPNLLDFWFLIEFISDAESKIFCSFEY